MKQTVRQQLNSCDIQGGLSSDTEIVNSEVETCCGDAIKPASKILNKRNISNDNIIRSRDLPDFLGISLTTCWRLEKDPSSGFPKKIRLSKGAVGFFRHQLLEYLESRQTVVEG